MDLLSTSAQSVLSPFTLFFLVGVLAGVLKSSLTIPETVSKSIALYLMIAIGYRGGAELSHNGFNGSIVAACVAAVGLGAALPCVAYALLRGTTRLDSVTAAAVSAHYGSVSAVTFAATIAVLNRQGERFEPYVVALMAVMEAPAILTGLALARRKGGEARPTASQYSLVKTVVHEVLLHGSVFLLLGSFAVGWITGSRGFEEVNYVFVKPFNGILCVFLLEIGLLVAQRLSDLKAMSPSVVAFGIYMPLFGACIGLAAAFALGLSVGGATLLAVLCASASYIVVPAVMRDALPKASPAIYMTLALGITFPFNLIVGIPLYHGAARALVPIVVGSGSPPAQTGVTPQKLEVAGCKNVYRLTEKLISGSAPQGKIALRALAALGVKTIVSVDGAKPDAALAAQYHIRYVHLPVGYDEIPKRRILELARAVRDLDGAVYLHCHRGLHRGPAAAAAVLVALGETSNNEAVEIMKTLGTSRTYDGLYEDVKKLRIGPGDVDQASAAFPAAADVPGFVEAMALIDRRFEHLSQSGWTESVEHPDIDPAHEALQLREIFADLNRTADVKSRPEDFRRWMAESESAAALLEGAIRSGDGPAAERAFLRIEANCRACHDEHRDKRRAK